MRSLADLDLNLLLALDALLVERSVTRAAQRVGLSQPAVSAALKKLRRLFDDELLVRTGNAFELTSLGSRLVTMTGPALAEVKRVFEATSGFDPTSAERDFRIVASDYAASTIGPLLADAFHEYPGIRLHLAQQTPWLVDHADASLRAVDGMILPHGYLADIPHQDLYSDTWVCLAAEDHPDVGASVGLEQLSELDMVTLFNLPTAFSPADKQLSLHGLTLRNRIVVDSFLVMPSFLVGSARVALVQRRLAARLVGGGLRQVELAFELAPLTEAFWWAPGHRRDPAHAWLRAALRRVSTEMPPAH